jgi:hypothetical protein
MQLHQHMDFDPDGDVVLILKNEIECVREPEEKVKDDNEDGGHTHPDADRESPSEAEAGEVYMRVSSKHLSLASRVFKSLLTGQFAESKSLKEHGSADIPLPGDNAAAFAILLNVVHGHLNKVPRMVDLATLTEISMLVDKVQLP